jgi:predicted dehydrogenase
MRVLGTAAAYVKYGLDGQEQALRDGGSPRDPRWGTEPEVAWGTVGTVEQSRPRPTRAGSYQDYYAGVRDALTGGGRMPVTIDEAIDVMVVIEAAQRSAREKAVVRLLL